MTSVGSEDRRGLLADYGLFLRRYRLWYLVPIAATLATLGYLVVTAGESHDDFVYDLF